MITVNEDIIIIVITIVCYFVPVRWSSDQSVTDQLCSESTQGWHKTQDKHSSHHQISVYNLESKLKTRKCWLKCGWKSEENEIFHFIWSLYIDAWTKHCIVSVHSCIQSSRGCSENYCGCTAGAKNFRQAYQGKFIQSILQAFCKCMQYCMKHNAAFPGISRRNCVNMSVR